MTNAEAIKVLSESIHYGSKVPWDKIVEAVHLSIEALSKPSLPSNLDEAAEEYALDVRAKPYGNLVKDAFRDGVKWCNSKTPKSPNNLGKAAVQAHIKLEEEGSLSFLNIFKAGAEWMAGRFQKIEGELVDWYSTSDEKDYCCGVKTQDAFEVPGGFYIRKK